MKLVVINRYVVTILDKKEKGNIYLIWMGRVTNRGHCFSYSDFTLIEEEERFQEDEIILLETWVGVRPIDEAERESARRRFA